MSILINGMDMPSQCDECYFSNNDFGCCKLIGESCIWGFKGRHPNCPLVEVLTPYGKNKQEVEHYRKEVEE